jgi:TonB family protein
MESNHDMDHLFKSAFLICLLSAVTVGQNLSKDKKTALFSSLADDEKAVAKCDIQIREEQIKKFGKPPPIISLHCFRGCPVLVSLPRYPDEAKRNRMSGPVRVEAIINEEGNVVFAKVIKGNPIFRSSALAAAYKSKYQPKKTCGERPIKFRWIINYTFRPTM